MDTLVRVRLGPAEATGRARRSGDRDGGTGTGSAKGLAPAMRAALARAEQLLGEPVPITSGYRSTAAQAALYANRASNPYPVAAPGTSMHERGLAIDVPAGFVDRLLAVAPRAGLCHPYPVDDPIHFEVCAG
jgi:D-alanyl-D-alanine carboxypeptidase-like protein